MGRALRAEILKIITTRTIYGLLAGEIGVVLLATASTVMSANSATLTGAINDQVFFLLVSINVGIFSLILGMRTITDEYRHSTIAHAFLSDSRRIKSLVAKGTAGALAAAALAGVSAIVMVGVAVPLAAVKQGSLSFSGSDVSAVAGFAVANALWAVLGVGVAAVVRHQIPAIVGGVVWVLVIENLGSGFLGDAGRYLPGQAAYALARALEGGAGLSSSAAGAVMAAYAVAAFAMGAIFVRRRDVV